MDNIPTGAIPVDQFESAAPSDTGTPPAGAIPVDQFESHEDAYGSTGQQVLTGVEGAAKGLLGPVATLGEKGLSSLGVEGLSPEEQEGRAQENPWVHGLSEAGGFGVGMLAGTGEAGLLAKAGEAVEGLTAAGEANTALRIARDTGDFAAIAKAKAAADAIPFAAKLGAGAAKAAAEMALLQTGDETSKYINDAPMSVGNTLAHIGLSAMLGGATGGIFSGLGVLGRKGIEAVPEGLTEFADRLKFRMSDTPAQEAAGKEVLNAFSSLETMQKDLSSNKVWADAAKVLKDPGKASVVQKSLKKALDNVLPAYEEAKEAITAGKPPADFVKSFDKYQKTVQSIMDDNGLPTTPIVGVGQVRDAMKQSSPWTKAADVLYNKALSQAGAGLIGGSVGSYLGEKTDLPGMGVVGALVGGSLASSVLPTILQPLLEKSIDSRAFRHAIEFAEAAVKGRKLVNDSAANLFKAGGMSAMRYAVPDDKKLDKLDKQVDTINQTPQTLVNTTKSLSHYMPAQGDQAMGTAGRAATYLNSIKPKSIQQNPLDTPIEPSKAEMAAYRKQLAIAESPLTIMNGIKDGSLSPQDVHTLQTVSPATYQQMTAAIQKELVDKVAKDENIPLEMRQSLSLFLGHPIDNVVTPAGIQATQSVYTPPQGANAQQTTSPKKAKGSAPLSKAPKAYQTPLQAAESDRADRN